MPIRRPRPYTVLLYVLFIGLATTCVLQTHSASAQAQEAPPPAWADAPPEIVSAVFSRTGIKVQNIDESLKLYQGILGLKPFYERKNLTDERLKLYSGMRDGEAMHLVVLRIETKGPLQANFGYLGLAEFVLPDGSRPKLNQRLSTGREAGGFSMIFLVDDMAETYAKVKAGGYDIISHPSQRENGRWTQMMLRGPDGERLWLTESYNRTPFLMKRDVE
ncbi:MAG: VOC family protein [Pseudomonadota bacterium]